MSEIGFDLESVTACRAGDADFFARLYRLTNRRQVLPLPQMQLDSDSIRLYTPSSLARHIKPLLSEGGEKAGNLAMVAWYRLCNHEGWRRLERIAIHVVRHPNAEVVDVQKVVDPKLDERGLATLTSAESSSIQYTAAVYSTMVEEQAEHPITQILEIPWQGSRLGAGAVALRGIETVIEGERLYR